MNNDKSKLSNIALIHPSSPTNKETFIQNQIDYLPFSITELCGGYFPSVSGPGKNSKSKLGNRLFFIAKILSRLNLKTSSEKLKQFAVKRVLKKNKVQLVLAQYGPTGMSMLPICKALKVPLVVYFLGFDASQNKTIKKFNNYQQLFCHCDAVIGVSRHICDRLSELGCPTPKINYCVCGVRNIFRRNEAFSNTSQILVSVARFVPKKAPYITILAFSKVLKKFPEAKLIMIGSGGELFDACRQIIKSLRIEDSINMIGAKRPEEIINILKSARAFVQHSVKAEDGDSEGTPVAILEANAMGIPVISTLHGGIPEVVIHNETGLLSEELDLEQMAKNMMELLQNSDLANRLGNNAKNHVENNYSIEITINNLSEILNKTYLSHLKDKRDNSVFL